ncbi:MAG: hypothetical protein M3441_13860 [Chloroflexota bacterium]|nr:hypothetical protein [Chloroflexota bacterium]
MTSIQYSMLFPIRAYLTKADLDDITQASVFLADRVWLPTTMLPSQQLSDDDRTYIISRLADLRSLGAIRLWQIEGQPEYLSRHNLAEALGVEADFTIPRDRYLEMDSEIDEQLMSHRSAFLRDEAASFDGVTEIVLGKQELHRFAICGELGANRLLSGHTGTLGMRHFLLDLLRYENFERQILDQLTQELQLPNVAALDIKDISRCRKHMPAFRAKLLQEADGKYTQDLDLRVAERIANAIAEDYLEAVEKSRRDSREQIFEEGRDITWDAVLHFVLPILMHELVLPIVTLRHLIRGAASLIRSNDKSATPLLWELRKAGKRSRRGRR